MTSTATNLKPGQHVWIGQELRYLTDVRTFDGRVTLAHGEGVTIVRADREIEVA